VTSLTACSSIELAHVSVDCLGQPKVSLNFTNEEAARFVIADDELERLEMTREEADEFESNMQLKIRKFAVTLRERVNTQCKLNKEHDELHKN